MKHCNFSFFPQYFQVISNFKNTIAYIFVKCGWLNYFFHNSANLICRGTDISKYFRESLGIRDNESRLYLSRVRCNVYLCAIRFDGVLNRPSSINDEAINRLPQVECNPLLDELSTVSETVKAIKLLSSGKAPGSDAIPAEIYKAGGPPVAEKLTELFHIMWRKVAIPQEFKDATIIHLFKRKGNPQVCDNHRGISLLSIAGKILARVLLNRLNEHLERSGFLPESQCGFRKNRGTIDMIFTARQLQENARNRMWTSTWPLSTLPKHLTQSVVRDFGKLWQSLVVLPNS